MVALALLDMVIASGQTPQRSARVAAQLARAALGELEEIETLEDGLSPEDPAEFDRQTAAILRGLYERWAMEAELLLERIERLQRMGQAIADADALRRAHGRTRARLSISLDDMEQGLRDAVEGRTVPLEEVRRELRLRVQQTGTNAVSATRGVVGGGNA